jgi:hypothetical protein
VQRRFPHGITAVGIFFFFEAAMAGLAGTTLLWRARCSTAHGIESARLPGACAPSAMVAVRFLLLSATLFVQPRLV